MDEWAVRVAVATLPAVIGTLIGLFIGSRIQIRNTVRDERRVRYLAWMQWLDDLPHRTWNAVVEDAPHRLRLEALRELDSLTTEIELLGSKRVRRRWEELKAKLSDEERKKAVTRTDRKDAVAAIRAYFTEGLEDERKAVLDAMRRDLGVKD